MFEGITLSMSARSPNFFPRWLFENNLELIFSQLDELGQEYVEYTAKLLNSHWPRTLESRIQSLVRAKDGDCDLFFKSICALMTNQKHSTEIRSRRAYHVIGHARVVQATQVACGVLESVIVADCFRGCGVGQQIVIQAEQAAKEAGIEVLFLNTTDKQNFYERLGYRVCSAPLWSANGKKSLLSAEGEEKLSSLFKGARSSSGSNSRVWMSKQLQ
jgi:N-acetylglutamate synthase-like GNAT family acetyltransferase